MKRKEVYQLVLNQIKICFSPTEEELKLIEKRLKQYDDNELKHFEENFTHFGIDNIIECFYSIKLKE